jgi:hypothetical protein
LAVANDRRCWSQRSKLATYELEKEIEMAIGAAVMMAQQKAQHQQQMMENHTMSMANSGQEHSQKLLGMHHESQRAMTNDQTKRATEMQADAAALLKDSAQKLDSGAGA